ncbi:MAG: glycan-binding surface protein [Dysgonamonadaceae bacterium]|jgi:hypothetical protein|nr:glycan-binding surface protein [Dysgonamonadaceae bacterium]
MNKVLNIILIFALLIMSFGCENEDEQVTGGKPEVQYVRALSTELPDNLVTGEFLGARLAIIGKGLAGVNKILFNDVPAVLNPAYITDNSIIVSIPSAIPGVKQNLIKLYTATDSCYYDFEVKVPAPTVNSMSFEWTVAGDVTEINGNYFIDDPNVPLQVTFTGDVAATIVDIDLSKITVEVPEGALEGPVTITSVYGSTKSPFHYKDSRNIIATFNNGISPDYDYYSGWHGGSGVATEGGINGNYLRLGDGSAEMTDDAWNDGTFSWENWTYLATDPDFFDASKMNNYVLKFEIKYTDWSAAALQIIFTGASDVMLNWQNGNGLTFDSKWGGSANSYVSSADYPRMLIIPWKDGIYNSDWTTVTIPMSECKYNSGGEAVSPQGTGHYSGLTLFVNEGGIAGTPCHPTLWIDNVRIVPAK